MNERKSEEGRRAIFEFEYVRSEDNQLMAVFSNNEEDGVIDVFPASEVLNFNEEWLTCEQMLRSDVTVVDEIEAVDELLDWEESNA